MKNLTSITAAAVACSSLLIITASSCHVYAMFNQKDGDTKRRTAVPEALVGRDEVKKAPSDSHLHTHIDKVHLKNAAAALHADPRNLRKYLQLDHQPEVSLLD